jgi:hypothetical protein
VELLQAFRVKGPFHEPGSDKRGHSTAEEVLVISRRDKCCRILVEKLFLNFRRLKELVSARLL